MKHAHRLLLLFSLLPLIALFMFPSLSSAASADNPTGDAERGKDLFERRCTGCHSLDQDKEGPHLRGVYGRKAGTVPTFTYSDAVKSAQITWSDKTLEKWLTDTESVIPGNDMTFRVPKPEERADIIQFLKVTSGK
jgi:cytochrome c